MNFCIKNVNIELTPAAVLVFAAFVYAERGTEPAALLIAVLTHELSHVIALRAFGAEIERIRVGAGGLHISFSGAVSRRGELASTLAGPLGGLLLAALCRGYGRGETVILTGRLSAYLSAFNLLPAVPLDGGRALYLLLRGRLNSSLCRRSLLAGRIAVSAPMLCLGVCLLSSGLGLILIFAALRIICTDFDDL